MIQFTHYHIWVWMYGEAKVWDVYSEKEQSVESPVSLISYICPHCFGTHWIYLKHQSVILLWLISWILVSSLSFSLCAHTYYTYIFVGVFCCYNVNTATQFSRLCGWKLWTLCITKSSSKKGTFYPWPIGWKKQPTIQNSPLVKRLSIFVPAEKWA